MLMIIPANNALWREAMNQKKERDSERKEGTQKVVHGKGRKELLAFESRESALCTIFNCKISFYSAKMLHNLLCAQVRDAANGMSSIIYDFHGSLMYLHLTKLQISISRNIAHKSAFIHSDVFPVHAPVVISSFFFSSAHSFSSHLREMQERRDRSTLMRCSKGRERERCNHIDAEAARRNDLKPRV
jgi:hypothetical protein